jgi:hypothetical protein
VIDNSGQAMRLMSKLGASLPVSAGCAELAALDDPKSASQAASCRIYYTSRSAAVLTIEGRDDANHDVHSPRDTLDRINSDLALEILRMNTAFLAGALNAT